MDERLLWYNILWLFFIVLLPFSTSLVSSYFFDTPAVFTYTLNTLFIACFQNLIWDYVAVRPAYLRSEKIDESIIFRMRLFCNLDMINGTLAVFISFFSPTIAFVLLFTKLPMLIIVGLFYRHKT